MKGKSTGRLVEARDILIRDGDLRGGVDGVDETAEAGSTDDADFG